MVACHFVQGESFFKAVVYSNLLELRDANRGGPVNAVGDQAANTSMFFETVRKTVT
jgi:hypothetical protein